MISEKITSIVMAVLYKDLWANTSGFSQCSINALHVCRNVMRRQADSDTNHTIEYTVMDSDTIDHPVIDNGTIVHPVVNATAIVIK